MSKLLKKAKSEDLDIKSRYEVFNLRENPFPNSPFINFVSPDIRFNGAIYESKIRENERNQFIESFIKPSLSNPNHIRLGYLVDNSYVGRGNGKSAFALNMINEINKNFGLDLSNEINKCFAIYVQPEPGGRSKTFYSFVDKLVESIFSSGLIREALGIIRLQALQEYPEIFEKLLMKSDSEIISDLNRSEWFAENNIKISDFSRKVYKEADLNNLSQDFPLHKDKAMAFRFDVTTQEKIELHYLSLKKGYQRLNFIFNDLVLLFKAAGFNGAYLFIDDFERIPDFQSEKLRSEFAIELRTNFFDGISNNAKFGFFNLILVLHAGVPRLIDNAWSVSGMVRRSPILVTDDNNLHPHIIKFEKLLIDHTRLLIEIYLEKYRIDENGSLGIFPFDEETISFLGEFSELNASSILKNANFLIERAIADQKELINIEYAKSLLRSPEDSQEMEQNSIDDSIDLFKKSKRHD